ncbi:MAG: hypothetical protein ACJ73S_03910 [Mycobacteriales bacterium]
MRDHNESFSLALQLGCVKEFLDAICRQVAEEEEHGWSIAELHVIYAALSSIGNLFASEEDFYIRLGFFRENAVAMALSLAEAIAASEAQ